MKQPRVIQRLSSLFLASLLLFTAVWGHDGLMAQQRAGQVKKAAHAAAVAKQAKSDKKADSHPEETRISAAGFEAVVTPAIQLGGSGQTAFLLPAPVLMILLLLSVPLLRHFMFPHYYFSYFRHVFGHAIAPNAP